MRKVVALALVAAGAALGAWLAWPDGDSAKTLAPIPFDLRRTHAFSDVAVVLGQAARPQPQMEALRRPRKATDALPSAAREQLARSVPVPTGDMALATPNRLAKTGPGAVEVSKSRLLLDGLGAGGSSLYGVPTAHGWVCFVLAPELLSKCTGQFADQLVWLALEQTETRTIATGIVPDRVRQVSLAIGKDTRVATLARNGFFGELPRIAADDLDAVIVKTDDGRTFRLPLDRSAFRP